MNYPFPQLGGVKLRGSNVAPPPSIITDPSPARSWYLLFYDLGINGASSTYWTQWLKPSIDAAASLGCNAIRFILDARLRVGSETHLTAGQFAAAIDVVVAYARTKGMYVYPALSDGAGLNASSLSSAQVQAYLSEVIAVVTAYTNCCGVDVVQEINSDPSGFAYTNRATWFTTAKAARLNSVPVTCSLTGVNSAPADNSTGVAIITAGGDFVDVHLYYLVGYHDFDTWLYNDGQGQYGTTYWPMIVGECGCTADDGSRAAKYTAFAAFANHRRIQAAFQWAIANYAPGGEASGYGIFASTQDGSYAFTTPNTDETRPWQTVAVATQAPNGEDEGPVASAPTVTWNGTTASLSWSAASNGLPPRVYTMQAIPLDASGFPVGSWQNGLSTSELSGTMTGFTHGTSYAFRIWGRGATS